MTLMTVEPGAAFWTDGGSAGLQNESLNTGSPHFEWTLARESPVLARLVPQRKDSAAAGAPARTDMATSVETVKVLIQCFIEVPLKGSDSATGRGITCKGDDRSPGHLDH